MIINGQSLLAAAPIKDMLTKKYKEHGVSYGLAEVGYDIRLRQDVHFIVKKYLFGLITFRWVIVDGVKRRGRFTLASSVEEFSIPTDLMGVVHDKSSWARYALSVFNTVLEPGWKGGLTLELAHKGEEDLHLPAGCGIAQVIFHEIKEHAQYQGKYQNQSTDPVPAIHE